MKPASWEQRRITGEVLVRRSLRQAMRGAGALFAVAVSALGAAAVAEPGGTLNIYNWVDYISPDTIPNFEKATGIAVHYDVYDENETLEAKLSAGGSGYDLVVPTLSPFLARQIKAGFYQELDRSKLPNWNHLDQALLQRMAKYDPGNAHAIPWTTGTNGIGYNVAKIEAAMPGAPIDSLRLLFDPAIVSKFKDCGVSMLDAPTDVYPAALNYLGLKPDSQNLEDLKKATQALLKIRPYIRMFSSSEYINGLANGDICLALGYSSDVNLARRRAEEAHNGVKIIYMLPKEGTQLWIDSMAIPKDAPHPDQALAFMNYIMDPKVMAATTNHIFIESGNADARAYTLPAIAHDPAVFPPPDVQAKLFTISPSSPSIDNARTRLWQQVKSGV